MVTRTARRPAGGHPGWRGEDGDGCWVSGQKVRGWRESVRGWMGLHRGASASGVRKSGRHVLNLAGRRVGMVLRSLGNTDTWGLRSAAQGGGPLDPHSFSQGWLTAFCTCLPDIPTGIGLPWPRGGQTQYVQGDSVGTRAPRLGGNARCRRASRLTPHLPTPVFNLQSLPRPPRIRKFPRACNPHHKQNTDRVPRPSHAHSAPTEG